MMFDTFKVNRFTLINQATLSLFSTGTTTGLVAESGEGLSFAVPIFEGFALPHAVLTLNVAGQDITERLLEEISKSNPKVSKNDILSAK
jgi:actin-related protein